MMEGFEDCNGFETFCETGSYNSTIHCNGLYDCYNRNDEDPRFCIATKQKSPFAMFAKLLCFGSCFVAGLWVALGSSLPLVLLVCHASKLIVHFLGDRRRQS